MAIIEPFHALHHKVSKIRFYPRHLPSAINKLLQTGKIHLLNADAFDPAGIFLTAGDMAVEAVEKVFAEYRKKHQEIIDFVSKTVNSPHAEYVFKRMLCERLAEFYSANMLFNKVHKKYENDQIVLYSSIDFGSYYFIQELLAKIDLTYFQHPNIVFPAFLSKAKRFQNSKQQFMSIFRLTVQTAASGFLSGNSISNKREKYAYGVSIVAPRQLRLNRRGPDLIVDHKRIKSEEIIYFPLIELTAEQKSALSKAPGNTYFLPKPGRFFSNFKEWKHLFLIVIKKYLTRNSEEIDGACLTLFNYFRWQKVMKDVHIRHFITHSDSGISHIGRNIALKQKGVKTWYFTDSANNTSNFKKEHDRFHLRHPFRTYLFYDHFVTWSEFMDDFYKCHPGSIKHTHVVGCLWSNSRSPDKNEISSSPGLFPKSTAGDMFKIGAFDTTYSINSLTSYKEGIAFAIHLLKLAETFDDIYIIFKEKKDRSLHGFLDPVNGPRLAEIYDKMNRHQRIEIKSRELNATDLISAADLVISFPFTSTTFEALSSNKPAIWHDSLGLYTHTPYSKINGVTTHSYHDLFDTVANLKRRVVDSAKNTIPQNSPLFDPYCDGKAVDRFIDLLVTSQ